MRPMRALMYTVGLCVAFAVPSLFFAISHRFDPVAIGVVVLAFASLIWMALMRPMFGVPLTGLRTAQVLRVVICARLLGALVPCGCSDMLTGGFIVEGVTGADLFEGPMPRDFAATLLITLGQGGVLVIEFLLMVATVYGVVRGTPLKHDPDICLACGYDLRASREIGRCPECGTPCSPLARRTE